MDIQEIRNNPAYHISYNPAFLIIRQDDDYMFYNSINHKAFRLNTTEFELLNLLYTYEDENYVFSLFEGVIQTEIIRLTEIIKHFEILKLEYDSENEDKNEDFEKERIPSTFYIHLTHNCNLSCSYCYNQEWRNKPINTLSYNDWEVIISKIIPYAQTIVLTGGEFLLVSFVPKILKLIKEKKSQIVIEGLSNGCLDYSIGYIQETLHYIDKITLSCDSLNNSDERIGFNKAQFLDNISFITQNFPNVKIAIATTITTKNHMATDEIKILCDKYGLEWSKTAVCPSSAKDTSFMIELNQQVNEIKEQRLHLRKSKNWFSKQIRCGAARTVCSIDSLGYVYPCQALHYKPFLMGNLLESEINELKYISDCSNVIPSVDDLMPCKICKVKYICGGGCFANRFGYNQSGKYSSLFCPMRYENSISMLLSLDNRK